MALYIFDKFDTNLFGILYITPLFGIVLPLGWNMKRERVRNRHIGLRRRNTIPKREFR